MGVLNLEVPPPSLEATVMRAAPTMLQHFMPAPGGAGAGAGAISSGPLRGQPLVRKALQLTQLLMDVGAVDGRSPSVGAGEATGGSQRGSSGGGADPERHAHGAAASRGKGSTLRLLCVGM